MESIDLTKSCSHNQRMQASHNELPCIVQWLWLIKIDKKEKLFLSNCGADEAIQRVSFNLPSSKKWSAVHFSYHFVTVCLALPWLALSAITYEWASMPEAPPHTHTQSNKGKSYQYVIAAMSWRRAADTHILYACVFSLTEPNVWMADDKHHLSSDIRDDRERQQKKNYCVFFLSHFSSIGQTFVRLSISPAFVWSSFHWHRRTSNGKYFSDHFLSIFLLCTCLLLVHTTESAKVICHNYLRMRLKLNPNTNNAMRCLMMRINSIWGFLTTMTTATI